MRWLAPLFVLFAVMVQSANAFATAGVENDVMCCCPSVEVCKCHEHERPEAPTHLGHCGGAVHEDTPILAVMTLPEPPVPMIASVTVRVAITDVLPIPPAPTYVPEKPPF
ncbi:MAG: hypothetical protein ABI867_36090 [Kofleriaceae bacterium]